MGKYGQSYGQLFNYKQSQAKLLIFQWEFTVSPSTLKE
jgi:hypothetical protein